MECIPLIGLLAILVVAFLIARFVLRLTARVIGCILTAILVIGVVAFLLYFVF